MVGPHDLRGVDGRCRKRSREGQGGAHANHHADLMLRPTILLLIINHCHYLSASAINKFERKLRDFFLDHCVGTTTSSKEMSPPSESGTRVPLMLCDVIHLARSLVHVFM
jgi:hypothetical protein